MTVKVNYIKDVHNNGKKYFETVLKLDQKCQRYGEIYQHIKIAKNLLKGSLAAIVSFLKTPEI